MERQSKAWGHWEAWRRQCFNCDRLAPAQWKYPQPPAPWLCPGCHGQAEVDGHFLTQLAEEVARSIMEADWPTQPDAVSVLHSIRQLVWLAAEDGHLTHEAIVGIAARAVLR